MAFCVASPTPMLTTIFSSFGSRHRVLEARIPSSAPARLPCSNARAGARSPGCSPSDAPAFQQASLSRGFYLLRPSPSCPAACRRLPASRSCCFLFFSSAISSASPFSRFRIVNQPVREVLNLATSNWPFAASSICFHQQLVPASRYRYFSSVVSQFLQTRTCCRHAFRDRRAPAACTSCTSASRC